MRIVAGELRGRPLEAPQGTHTRPTTDRVREALFSSLYSQVGDMAGMVVLDAFAGSGALSFEALSRGAAKAVLFDSDEGACRAIRSNAQGCGLGQTRWELHRADVLQARVPAPAGGYQLIFLDPPYALDPDEACGLLGRLRAEGALAPGACIAYEHGRDAAPAVAAAAQRAGFEAVASKRYGKTAVTFLKEGQ